MAARRQEGLWVTTEAVARRPGHPFYEQLNQVLTGAGIDRFCEENCRKSYHARLGRPSVPPGVYFRVLLVGDFEKLPSERQVAWRCADSLSLRAFLGLAPGDGSPDDSSLNRSRLRIDRETRQAVFDWVLKRLAEHELLKGQRLGIDTSRLEANAGMRSIVRRETGQGYREFLTDLAKASGIATPTAEELAKFDRKRKGKKCSNDDWFNPNDPDAKVAKMKDGTTPIAHKAEHAVDLESELLLAATVQPGDSGDPESLPQTLVAAQVNLMQAGSDAELRELATDSGYHSNATLTQCADWGIRTYISEKDESQPRVWTDKPAGQERAFRNNRRRIHGRRGRR